MYSLILLLVKYANYNNNIILANTPPILLSHLHTQLSIITPKLAGASDIMVSKEYGSLKILREYLIKKEHEKDLVESIMCPLFELNDLHSNISSHSQSRGEELLDNIIDNHGDLGKHFKHLIQSCDQSIKKLREILK